MNLKYLTKTFTFSIFFLFLLNFAFLNLNVLAISDYDIPTACPDTYKPDFNCINKKLIDPTIICPVNVCNDADLLDEGPQIFEEIEVFGANIAVRSDRKLVALINLSVTTFLGAVSLYALVRGIYIAGVERVQKAESAADLERINQELLNLVIGFLISWGFIFIMQFIFNLLGLGSLNELILVGAGATNDGSKIVIKST